MWKGSQGVRTGSHYISQSNVLIWSIFFSKLLSNMVQLSCFDFGKCKRFHNTRHFIQTFSQDIANTGTEIVLLILSILLLIFIFNDITSILLSGLFNSSRI